MSTQGASPPKPIEDSAFPTGESSNAEHRATLAKPTALAHHLKEPIHVIDDQHKDESDPVTTILHKGQDGQPTITRTAYEKEDPGQSVLHIINAISNNYEDGKRSHESEDERKSQLEDYFQGLKSEFKAKTGREWDPLRPWPAEEWEWVWDDEEP